MRFVTSLPLIAVGGLLGIYGLFALAYGGDGGTTYVTLMGRQINAHVVGAVCLAFGLAAVAAGIALVRQGRIRN